MELGWTQPDTAAKVEIEQSYLSKLENGKAYPSDNVFGRLVEILELDVSTLNQRLFPGELDRLRDVELVRQALLKDTHRTRTAGRRWLVAGLILVMIGGACLGLTQVDATNGRYQYTYQSTGVILAGENLDVFELAHQELDPELESDAEQLARRNELIARIDDQVRTVAQFRGPMFIESVAGGQRMWRLVGGVENTVVSPFWWAVVPGTMLLLGGLGCFFVSWRWR